MKRLALSITVLLLVPSLVRLLMAQAPSAPPPPPQFTLTDLGPLNITAAPSGATALNSNGQVTGFRFENFTTPVCFAGGANRAFWWDKATNPPYTELGTLGTTPNLGASSSAYGINNAGQIVGSSDYCPNGNSVGQRAFIWQNGVMTALDPSTNSNDSSATFAINANGDVAGYTNHVGNSVNPQAVIWKGGTAAGLSALQSLACQFTACQTRALAINDSGQAAGWGMGPFVTGPLGSYNANQAVMWDANGKPTGLGSLGSYFNDQANAINSQGMVVGYSQIDPYTIHAVLWQNGNPQNPQDLGAIPGLDPNYSNLADNNSSAWGINSKGDIVGISGYGTNVPVLGNGGRAFLYTAGTMYDLASLLSPGTNWKLKAAWAINDNGQIVGVGFNPAQQEHGFLLTPITTPTTTALSSSVNPSVFGQQVSFSATVTPTQSSSLTLTGSVTFNDGSTVLGTVALSSGTAVFNTSALAVGSHSITASYGGDSNFALSTSTALSQTVNQGTTTTTVAASPNPGIAGQPVTLTATVTVVAPASGTSTGTVTFLDGTTALGTGTVSGGQATLTTSSLTIGSHSLTATYAGDINFLGATSLATTLAVKQGTTTTLAASPNPSNTGQSVTLTATVAANSTGTTPPPSASTSTPTGNVTFLDGANTLGTGTLTAGVATFGTSSLTAGSHSLTASFPGDTNFGLSTSSVVAQTVYLLITVNESIAVSDAPTLLPSAIITVPESISVIDAPTLLPSAMITVPESISVTDVPTVLPAIQISVTEAISVTDVPTVGNTPTGSNVSVTPSDTTTGGAPVTVTFTSVTQTGMTRLTTSSTGTPPPSGFELGSPPVYYDIATTAAFTPPVTLCIHYAGASFFGFASLAPHLFHLENSVWVDRTTTVDTANMIVCGATASLSPFALFAPKPVLTITANNATRQYGQADPPFTASFNGFVNGDTAAVLSGTLVCTSGTTASSPVSGSPYAINCAGLSSLNYAITYAPGQLTIMLFPLTVTANNATRPYGAPNPAFSGSITGIQNGDNITATYATAATPTSTVGMYAIVPTLVDPGGKLGNFAVTLNKGTLTVIQASTTTGLSVTPNPSNFGQSVTLTATVAPVAPGAGTATGKVTFLDGSVTLGTGALSSADVATFITSSLSAGTHSLTASYSGDPSFSGSSSSAVSDQVQCGVLISLSPSSVPVGGIITVTGKVISCSTTTQTVVIQFTLSGPSQPNSCSSTKSVMFTTPPFPLVPKTSQTVSFPFKVPSGVCPGTYSITATTHANSATGAVLNTSTATLAVTAH
jgi:probable HAF family extracellular repeat protein